MLDVVSHLALATVFSHVVFTHGHVFHAGVVAHYSSCWCLAYIGHGDINLPILLGRVIRPLERFRFVYTRGSYVT